MKRLFVSDIDGTLYWYNQKNNKGCSPQGKKAINDWLEAGNYFALATARTYLYRNEAMADIGVDVDYLGGNGAEVILADSTKILHGLPMSYFLEAGKWIEENGYDATVKICCRGTFLAFRQDKYPYTYPLRMRRFLKTSVLYNSFEFDENELAVNMSVLVHPSVCKEVEASLQKIFEGRCIVQANDFDNIDFIPLNVSKKQAIIDLANHYGIEQKDIIVIGDAPNDISMFELTENSYCMASGFEAAKQKANHIVDLFEQAVYQQLEKEKK